jgi:hypothetical protein
MLYAIYTLPNSSTHRYSRYLLPVKAQVPLPSLAREKLNLLFLTPGELTATLDIVSDHLESTIIPAFHVFVPLCAWLEALWFSCREFYH